MIQFYNEYNEELTLPKDTDSITQLPVAQLQDPNTQSSIAQLRNIQKKKLALPRR